MTANTELDVEQQDEYFLDTPAIRDFVAAVQQVIAEQDAVEARLTALQPRFAELLGDQSWLTEEFAAPNPQSGMGGGIGTWLLFRAAINRFRYSAWWSPPVPKRRSTTTWPGVL